MNIYKLEKIVAGWDDAYERQDNEACWAAYAASQSLREHGANNFMRALDALKCDIALLEMVAKSFPGASLSINGDDVLANRRALIAKLEEVKT